MLRRDVEQSRGPKVWQMTGMVKLFAFACLPQYVNMVIHVPTEVDSLHNLICSVFAGIHAAFETCGHGITELIQVVGYLSGEY